MSDIFNEVEERYREERLMQLTRKYGPAVAVALVIVLLAAGAWYAWRYFDLQNTRQKAEAFSAAAELYEGGQLDEAQVAFEAVAADGARIYRQMARMQLAAIQADRGDLEGAIAAFDAVAAEAQNPIVRDSARLRAAYLVADTQDLQALRTRLEPLSAPGAPLRGLAQELLGFELWEAGDFGGARQVFEQLTLDLDTPESVRNRIESFLASVLPPNPTPAAPASEEAAPAETAEPAPAAQE